MAISLEEVPSTITATTEEGGGDAGKGKWTHAAFHVATTIATPAAYAPLPFALASLGWPLGNSTILLQRPICLRFMNFLICD